MKGDFLAPRRSIKKEKSICPHSLKAFGKNMGTFFLTPGFLLSPGLPRYLSGR